MYYLSEDSDVFPKIMRGTSQEAKTASLYCIHCFQSWLESCFTQHVNSDLFVCLLQRRLPYYKLFFENDVVSSLAYSLGLSVFRTWPEVRLF